MLDQAAAALHAGAVIECIGCHRLGALYTGPIVDLKRTIQRATSPRAPRAWQSSRSAGSLLVLRLSLISILRSAKVAGSLPMPAKANAAHVEKQRGWLSSPGKRITKAMARA